MENLKFGETKYTPDILFDCKNNSLEIRGKSYPENTAEFYAPVFSWLETYLEQLGTEKVIVNVELTYFNSSSSKVFMDIFDMLEEAAGHGKHITLNWIYDEDDEMIMEYGEDFKEDLNALNFRLVEKTEKMNNYLLS